MVTTPGNESLDNVIPESEGVSGKQLRPFFFSRQKIFLNFFFEKIGKNNFKSLSILVTLRVWAVHGTAWHGTARHCTARHGTVQQGTVP